MEYEGTKPKIPLVKEGGWTVEEFYDQPDDGNLYELDEGVLELLSAPTTKHQIFSGTLDWILKSSCRNDYIIISAPVDVILSNKEIRQPDIVMIHRSRRHIITERSIVGPPDLVVEVLSPSTVKKDRKKKWTSYARFGVPEYWIVDPLNRTLERYVLPREGGPYELADLFDQEDHVASDKLPCVSFALRDVFVDD
jgi:Uma2 family endonuclease